MRYRQKERWPALICCDWMLMSHHFSLEQKKKDGETEASRIMRREETLKKREKKNEKWCG